MPLAEPPGFLRPAEQVERDAAGNAQRRLEASLHSRFLSLAETSGGDWWIRLISASLRRTAEQHAARDGGSREPSSLVRRLAFIDFMNAFRSSFGTEFEEIFSGTEDRVRWKLRTLDDARDGAAHAGKPYLAAEAQLAVAVAHECAIRLHPTWHDPPDLVAWLRGLTFGENEGFRSEEFDCASGRALFDWSACNEVHRLTKSFRAVRPGGDMGFGDAVESLLAARGFDVYMRAGELRMGTGLPAFSGLFHEHDLGLRGQGQVALLELKNYPRSRVTKSDLLLFNQKSIDFYIALIQASDGSRMSRVFVTTDRRVPDSLRGFCLQWGILLVEPTLIPIPCILTALRDLDGKPEAEAVPEFEAQLNRAERLAQYIRPLDRVLIPSTLSRWRQLLDVATIPSQERLTVLVEDHRRLDTFVRSFASVLR